MKTFGDTIRDLRVAQELGLRETAAMVGISPAYLSRIERGKERPPRPEAIKSLAKVLAADPDVLFRLSSSTDPEVINFLNGQPGIMNLIRRIKELDLRESEIDCLFETIHNLRKD